MMSPHNFKGSDAVPSAPDNASGVAVDPFYIGVDAYDIAYLKSLQAPEEFGPALRLWWDPAPARGQKAGDVTPSHVTIMAETTAFRTHVLARLNSHRAKRANATSDEKMFQNLTVAARPAQAPPAPTQGPWGRRRDDDDGLCAA